MPRLGAVWVRPAVWPAPAEGATPRSSLRDRPSPGAEMDKGCTRGRAEPELACRPRGFPGTPRRDRAEGSEGPWSKGRSWKGVTGFSVGPVCSARGSATRDTCQRPGTPRAVTEQRRACRGCHRCPDGAHRAEAGPRVGGVRGAFVGVAPRPSCCPPGVTPEGRCPRLRLWAPLGPTHAPTVGTCCPITDLPGGPPGPGQPLVPEQPGPHHTQARRSGLTSSGPPSKQAAEPGSKPGAQETGLGTTPPSGQRTG